MHEDTMGYLITDACVSHVLYELQRYMFIVKNRGKNVKKGRDKRIIIGDVKILRLLTDNLL